MYLETFDRVIAVFALGQAGKVQTYGLQRRSSSGRRTRLPTAKWSECAKEFAASALGDDDKSLCGSVLKAKNVHPFRQAQIASLDIEEVPVTIPAEYSDYTDVFPSDSATALPKYTGINNHPINLVDNKQPSYALPNHPPPLQYCPSARRTVAFNCASEVSITGPSGTGTCCL